MRIEQAACATLSIEFGGDEGLAAAANRALTDAVAAAARTGVGAYAQVMRAIIVADEFLMRGEMDLPPAITLVAQALMTLLFGFIGLMVAVPLTAAVLVPLRMMAERENAREKAMVKYGKQQDMARAEVDPKVVMGEADRGPLPKVVGAQPAVESERS